MRAGSLRHLIEIQKPTRVPLDVTNDTGETITEWTTVDTVYAAIQPQRGIENTAINGITEGKQVSVFTIRFTENIDRHYRIKFNNRVYSINSIINYDERDRELQIHATEIVGETIG